MLTMALHALLLTSCGVESILRQADQSYELGEYNEAAARYKKAYSKTEAKQRDKRAERAFKTAECYRRINMNSKAMAAYRNAIRYNYPDSMMYKHMADLQLEKGDYKGAIANYDIYLEYNPTDTTAINGRKACTTAPQWKKSPLQLAAQRILARLWQRGLFAALLHLDTPQGTGRGQKPHHRPEGPRHLLRHQERERQLVETRATRRRGEQ